MKLIVTVSVLVNFLPCQNTYKILVRERKTGSTSRKKACALDLQQITDLDLSYGYDGRNGRTIATAWIDYIGLSYCPSKVIISNYDEKKIIDLSNGQYFTSSIDLGTQKFKADKSAAKGGDEDEEKTFIELFTAGGSRNLFGIQPDKIPPALEITLVKAPSQFDYASKKRVI